MSNIIDYYKYELDKISNERVRLAVEYMLDRAPKYYMQANAASNPNYCKDRDGNIVTLKEHTKQVARYMISYLSHPMIGSQFDDYTRDCMIGATLIHDLAKFGLDEEASAFILFEHPILVSQLVDTNIQNYDLPKYNILCELIRLAMSHNGSWTTNNKSSVILPYPQDNAQFYVHLCDWMASRSYNWIDSSNEVVI